MILGRPHKRLQFESRSSLECGDNIFRQKSMLDATCRGTFNIINIIMGIIGRDTPKSISTLTGYFVRVSNVHERPNQRSQFSRFRASFQKRQKPRSEYRVIATMSQASFELFFEIFYFRNFDSLPRVGQYALWEETSGDGSVLRHPPNP